MFSTQIHKDAFIRHLKQCNLLKDFQVADPESESYWKNRADLAFKYHLNFNAHFIFYPGISRIFDKDGDGFVSKKEFKWMTANKRINMRKVNIMFEVCVHCVESIDRLNNKYYQRCDLNKDGRLDYNEFKALIYRNKERKDLNAERAKAMVRRKSSKMQELREMKKSV